MRALAAVFAAIATFLLIRAAALVVLDVDVVPSPPPAVAMAGCNRLEARSATDKILSGAQLVCIATSMFFDVDEVARACEAAPSRHGPRQGARQAGDELRALARLSI